MAVVIPLRTSIFDICAITPIVEICRERHEHYAFLMSAVDPHARADLVEDGPVFVSQ